MALLDHDLLVIDQVTSFLTNDFAIRDGQGLQIGHILTRGGALSLMFRGPRQLSITDADGSPLMGIDDVPNFGRDTYDLLNPDGQRFGEVIRKFTLFSKHLSVQVASGILELRGNFFDREFSIAGPQGEVARVSRRWPGLAAALLDRERYVLAFAPGVPTDQRAGMLGAVVALDLIRHKEEQAASHNNNSFGAN